MGWIIYAFLSAVFAALVAILGKIGVKNVDTTLSTTIRSLVMAGFLVATTILLGKSHGISGIDKRSLLFIFFSGIAGALSWLFYFVALKNGPAAGVAALDRLSVVFVAVFAALLLREPFTAKTLLGISFITFGAFLMIGK